MTVTLEEVRARGIALPTDDDAAQGAIDEQEAWLARRIGPLEGERTEEFYVGRVRTEGELGLRRYTDAVVVVDNGVTVAADTIRLVERGSAFRRRAPVAGITRWWTGPYVTAAYTPNDLTEVRGVLFSLLALAGNVAASTGPFESERIGDYSYTRAGNTAELNAQRRILADSLLPPRDRPGTLYARPRRLIDRLIDPVINLPEVEPYP